MLDVILRYLKFIKAQVEPSPSELKGLLILILIAFLGIGYDYYQKITSPVSRIENPPYEEVLKDAEKKRIEEENFVVERRRFYRRKPLREGEKININTANISELARLHGIGPKIAERIYEYRKKVGKFKTVDELMNVKGLGPKKLEKIKPYITL